MKLTKKIEQEVLKVYNTGWDAYMKGDLKTHAPCLSRDFKIIGTTDAEHFNTKKAWLAFCKKTIHQVVGVVQMRNRKIKLDSVGDGVMVVENSDIYVLIEGKWQFYSKIRITALLQNEKTGWKWVHQHGSLPDTRASENETIATEKIKKENQQLREAVKRRTVELEHKNRELAIEAAMEKVRARSLAMQKPEELVEVAEVLRNEMGKLGVEELETSSIYIVDENKATTACWYAIKDVRGKNKRLVTDHMTLVLDDTWVGREMQKFYRSKQTRTSILMRGKNRKEWINYCADKSSVLQGYYGGEIPERTYHLLKFSNGFMGAASPGEISAESWDLLQRATGVFSFAYKRFSDLQKAEAQAREAQIQLALERVRARTMAMQKSEELPEAAALLFQQVQSLGMPAWSAGYCLWNDDDKKSVTLWMSSEGVIQPPFTAPTTKDALFIQMRKGAEEGKTLHVVEMGGKQLVKHYQYMRTLPVVGEILDSIIAAGHPLPTFQIMHQAYFSKGFLLFITYQPVPDVHEIFKRFAKVFDQTYIRFLDLQKAEAQAREAQIEAALERIRSRALAMHTSQEIFDVALVLREQMGLLGQPQLEASVIHLYNTEMGLAESWHALRPARLNEGEIIYGQFNFQREACDLTMQFFDQYLSGQTEYTILAEGEKLKEWVLLLFEKSPDIKKYWGGVIPEFGYHHFSVFSGGALLAVTGEKVSDEARYLQRRAANVFDLAYKRYLDLQKAEAQAREAEIQLALERVRAQTMAMHNSEDMGKCIVKMFSELTALGVDEGTRFGIGILNQENENNQLWTARKDGEEVKMHIGNIDMASHPLLKSARQAWLKQVPFHRYVLEGEDLLKYYQMLNNAPDYKIQIPLEQLPKREIQHCFIFEHGFFYAFSHREFEPELIHITKRFTSQFAQTYRRYLDLVRAEAQAREAQIEAALERVRSRSMAMHKSEELRDVIQLVFEQLVLLDFDIDSAQFDLNYKENDDLNVWTAIPGQPYPRLQNIPYADTAIMNSVKYAKEKGLSFFSHTVTREEKNEFFRHFFNHVNNPVPEKRKKYIFDKPAYARSIVFLNNIFLGIQNYSGVPYSEAENTVLMRFGKAFEQAYTRFLDLQKAEAQAREAKIETALEKIRSRSLAMHRSDELKEVISVMFEKLTELRVLHGTVALHLLNRSTLNSDFWVGTTMQEPQSVSIPYDEKMMQEETYLKDSCKAIIESKDIINKTYTREQKDKFFNYLFSKNSLTKITQSARDYISQTPGQLVCLISVGNAALFADSFDGAVYTETELTVLRRAARVFEQAYVRFLDLQKVEAQAKEAQIEAALERVRSRSMAMHKSEELSEVASVLFHQLQGLGIDSLRRSAVNIMNESEAVWECWYTSLHGDSFAHLVKIPVLGNPAVAALTSSWQKQELFKVELAGAALNDFMQFLISHGWKYAPGDSAPQKFTMSGLPFSHGVVLTFTSETLKAEEIEILKRFAIVFEQCYTRFLDLQKAEVQTRESEIELALERVRARTMSMQKSEDLREVVKVLYVQLKELGFKNGLAAINIMDSDSGDVDSWSEGFDDGYDLPEKYRVPYFEHNGHRALISHWKSGAPYAEVEIAGQDKKSFDNYYFFHTDFVKVPEATKQLMMQPEAILFSMAYMQYGALTWAPTPISEEQSKILQRFAKVFEQTYTRFLDLQKAEAQAREAQIEAALERVRSKTMAMHNSQDVGVSVAALFNELEMLGILDPQDRCGIGIMQTDEIMEVWTAAKTLEGKDELTIGTLDMKVHPLLQQAYLGWKTKKESNQYILEGDDKTRYYQAIRDQQNYTLKRDYFSDYTKVIHTDFYFNEGCLFVFSRNEFQTGPSAIIIRFANLFGQTYRRYLDLQKAETQAREATIEAALEKVRGKALAMHNSNDLTVTAGIVFTELRKLGINSLRGGVGLIDNKESRLCKMYSATSSGEGDTLSLVGTILLNGHPVLSKIWDNIIDQSDYFPVLKGELLESYYTHLSSTFNVPFAKSTHKEEYGCFLTFSEGGFYVWSEKPYTEMEIKILQRFKSIIDLTIRRYLELQKSEAAAKDAIRQASLDRVRAEIASMRTTKDLERITPLIWKELTALAIPFIRCGVFIMDAKENKVHTYLSAPDGRAIGAYHTPMDNSGSLAGAIDGWKQQKEFVTHWGESDFQTQADVLLQQGAITSREQYLNTLPREGFHLHFLPFRQGMLYVGSNDQLQTDALQLVQSLADAFSVAYARYEDFNKLESAKEQIEKTLSDLKQTQTQLIQSEKMASLGELTAGIAHEIQNPLNFVNNFSEVNTELIDELKKELAEGNKQLAEELVDDIKSNSEKINHHGKRAGDIVKGMLQHSRSSSGVKEATDINALTDEYLRLAYHGLRAKDKSFNATMKTEFDESIGSINIIPQDMGRVILNLITNAFYAVNEKSKVESPKSGISYEPIVIVSTKKIGDKIAITVKDNGNGIPHSIKEKIFQPFFTTKPTGQGTGLGLSLSYDIVKAHGGELKVETKEGESSEFIIQLRTN